MASLLWNFPPALLALLQLTRAAMKHILPLALFSISRNKSLAKISDGSGKAERVAKMEKAKRDKHTVSVHVSFKAFPETTGAALV